MNNSKHHNKKRNTGIIFELLLRQVSAGLVEGDHKSSDKTLDIIRQHFNPNSELYKEFRLFNALVKTNATSDVVVNIIMREAREIASSINTAKLDDEKTSLIHSINHTFDKDAFYSRRIPEYKVYATIQTLVNDWRDRNPNITRMASYEEKVRNWLRESKLDPSVEEHVNKEVDPLVLRIMSEKVNKKLSKTLTREQIDVVNAYLLSSSDLTSMLKRIKESALTLIPAYVQRANNETLSSKLNEIVGDVTSLPVDEAVIDDDVIIKYMTISRLIETINAEEAS